jgi:hypothetical protein
MSSTTNIQSYLPYVFRPVYTWNGTSFTTTVNISNVDSIVVNTASFGRMNIGDSNQNVYVGCNAGNQPSNATAFVTYYNTALGISAGAGISNASNSEFIGYLAGNSGKAVYETIVIGMNAGGLGATSNSISNVYNSIFMGTSNSLGLSNVSNTISIGANAGGGGSWGIYLGTSNSIGASGNSNMVIGVKSGSNITGSGNLILGNGVYPTVIPPYTLANGTVRTVDADMSNKFLLGSGSNIIAAGDFSNNIFVIGSTNTNSYTCNVSYPTSQIANISLDVYKYARFQQGISIGRDPGIYTLDVNGQFRASDGFGQLAFSNTSTGVPGSSNSYVEVRPADNSSSTMTFQVTGNTTVSSNVIVSGEVISTGYLTVQSSGFLALGATLQSVSPGVPSVGQCTYTTLSSHGFTAGQTVTIAVGTGFTAGYMGVTAAIIGSPGTTTFVIANATTGGTTTGSAVVGVVYPVNTAKNGLLLGVVYDVAGTANYHNTNVLVRTVGNTSLTNVSFNNAVGAVGCTVNGAATAGIAANSISVSNMTGANLTLAYNFTYLPTS